MPNRRELVLAIVSDASQFSKGFDKAAKDVNRFGKQASKGISPIDTRVKAVSASFTSLAATAGIALGVGGLVSFARGAVDAASDLEESVNAVNVTFGDAADGVNRLGAAAARNLGLARSEFNSLSVSFAAFTQTIADQSGRSVTGVLEELTTRAADFASVMNLDVAEAATKFRSGLAGETEPLRQFGIDLSAARVNARALSEGLASTTSELTEQDKVLARYLELLDQTSQTAGDFANTSDSLANAQRIATAEFKDAQAELGKTLIPAMTQLLKVGTNLIPVISDIANILGVFTGTFDLAAEALRNWQEEHGFAAETTRDITAAILEEAEARKTWADAVLTGTGPLEAGTDALIEYLSTIRDVSRLEEFRDEIIRLGEAGELTKWNVLDLEQAIDQQLTKAMDASADEVLKSKRGLEGWASAMGDAEATTGQGGKTVRALVQDLKALRLEQLALVNPIVGGIEALSSYEEALAASEEALKKYGEGSAEANEAGLALIESYARLVAEATAIADSTGVAAVDALRTLATQAGLTDDQIQFIIDSLDELDGFVVEPEIRFRIVTPSGILDAPEFVLRNIELAGGFHNGGVVPGPRGSDQLILAAGGETILPTHKTPAGFGDLNINIAGNVDDTVLPDIERELLLASFTRTGEVG